MKQFPQLEFLHALRGAAAFYVLVHHYVHCNNELAYLMPYFKFGQVAVMVFFVLSGFVIYYSLAAKGKPITFKDYFLARFRRIYPIFVLTMLINWVLRCWVLQEWSDFRIQEFLGNIFQLQDAAHPGNFVHPYMQNDPLWSLAYEWWFYMLFFVAYTTPYIPIHRKRYVVLAFSTLSLISYWLLPNPFSMYFSYFILWWTGLELAREFIDTGHITLRRQWTSLAGIAALGLAWMLPTLILRPADTPIDIGEFPFLQARHFFTVLAILLVGWLWHKLGFVLYRFILRPFIYIAPISYALYVVHLPFIHFANAFNLTGNVYLDLLWVLPLIFLVAWLMEQPLQRWINAHFR